MSNPDNLSFFYLQQGGVFRNDYDPLTAVWTDMKSGHCVVPESLRMEAGPEPTKLVFHVYADPVNGPQGVFPPIASVTTIARRPDGIDSQFTLPAYEGVALKPFTLIRLLENPTEATPEEGTVRFVGLLVNAELDLATDTWTCTAMELPRWRMSKYTVKGQLWHNTNLEGNVPPDPVNPMVFHSTFPIFNEDGKRNMFVDAGGNRLLEFYHPDFKYSSYLVAFWRPGDILNYLRKCWWEIVPATGLTILGVEGISKYVNWPEVTEATHPWLFVSDTVDQVLDDMPLGSMSLLEAVDAVIRKSGKGAEWSMTFDNGTLMWDLDFYDKSGISNVTLTRGEMGSDVGEVAQISEGTIAYDWTHAADNVTVYGQFDKHEVTIAYDPNGVMLGTFPDIIKPDWDGAAQTAYQSAQQKNSPAAATDFPGVFIKFRFREDIDWDYAFYGSNVNITKQGQREFASEMLTKLASGSGEIQARVWRWTVTVDGDANFTAHPTSVGVTFNEDGSFAVHGNTDEDENIPQATKHTLPRYLCAINYTAPTDPWTIRPFILVLSVLGDYRALGNSAVDAPADWPTGLEDCPDLSKLMNHYRYRSVQMLDGSGKPTEDSGTQGILSSISPENINDVNGTLYAAAKRRRESVERPECKGVITLGGHPDWDIVPGRLVEDMTGGGGDWAHPPLPKVYAGVLIKKVTFTGLGTRGAVREQQVEMSNG